MFAFVKTPHWERADEETKEAFGELIEHLGDRVEEVELFPSAAEAWQWHETIMEAEMAANLEREWKEGRDRLSDSLRAQVERGRGGRAVAATGPGPPRGGDGRTGRRRGRGSSRRGAGAHVNEAHRLASADQLSPQIIPQGPLVLLHK